MKIVILDGATAKGRELNFDFLNQFGEVTYYDVTYPDEVLSRAKDADILVINKIVLDRATLSACKKLKLITILATGYNVVDIDAAPFATCRITAQIRLHSLRLLLYSNLQTNFLCTLNPLREEIGKIAQILHILSIRCMSLTARRSVLSAMAA